MKKLAAITALTTLALAGCSNNQDDIKPSEITSMKDYDKYQEQQERKKENEKVDPAKIGETYTWDCSQNEPCEMKITVTEITPVIPCPYGSYSDEQGVPGKKYILLRGELETTKSSNFENVFNFDQVNKDGYTESIMSGASCMDGPGETWSADVHQGDKKKVSGVFEVSEDAEKIIIEHRYTYKIPDVEPVTPEDAHNPDTEADYLQPEVAEAPADYSPSEGVAAVPDHDPYPRLENGNVDEGKLTEMFWECMEAGGTEETCRL